MTLHSTPPSPDDSRLVVLIDEAWPELPAARWALLDRDGRSIADGCGAPGDWPQADTLQVVLGGWQTSLHDVRLPRGRRGTEPRVLAYAMEDALLQPPDTQHLTVLHRQPDGDAVRAAVVAVDRVRLQAVLDALEGCGRMPRTLFSELEFAPHQDGAWSLSLRPGTMVLRRGVFSAVALDAPTAAGPLPLDGPLLAALTADGASARELIVHSDSDDATRTLRHALPALHVEHADTRAWWTGTAASSLLHGVFTPPAVASAFGRRLRLPVTLAAIGLAVVGVIEVGDLLWQRHLLARTEAEIDRIFATTLTGVPAVMPVAQLERHRDTLRARHGRLREDDLFAQLAIFSQARSRFPAASITTLDYDRGRLMLDLDGVTNTERLALNGMLARQRQTATQGMDGTSPGIEIVAGANR